MLCSSGFSVTAIPTGIGAAILKESSVVKDALVAGTGGAIAGGSYRLIWGLLQYYLGRDPFLCDTPSLTTIARKELLLNRALLGLLFVLGEGLIGLTSGAALRASSPDESSAIGRIASESVLGGVIVYYGLWLLFAANVIKDSYDARRTRRVTALLVAAGDPTTDGSGAAAPVVEAEATTASTEGKDDAASATSSLPRPAV